MPPDRNTELPVIRAALARMRSIGGVCTILAGTVDAMLAHDRIHLYGRDQDPDVGAMAPVGLGVDSYILLSRDLIARYFNAAHRSGNIDSRGVPRPETLQLVLAHEADHVRGAGHIDADGYLTANAMRCSDIH